MELRLFTDDDIVTHPDSGLAQVAPATAWTDEITDLGRAMFSSLAGLNAVGLAANQIGRDARLFVADLGEGEPWFFLNAQLVARSENTEEGVEGCLSIPGHLFLVNSPEVVTATYVNEHGEECTTTFTGYDARVVRHEVDHLNGRVILDHGVLAEPGDAPVENTDE